MKTLRLLVLTAIILTPALVSAEHASGVSLVDAEQLKRWIDGGKQMTLVDSRVPAEYKAGHIPTAINILSTTMEKERGKLPGNKKSMLVFYCNGWPECKKSHDA